MSQENKENIELWLSPPSNKNKAGLTKFVAKDKETTQTLERLILSGGKLLRRRDSDEFIISEDTVNDETLPSKSLHLSVVDIEGGGPQPRTKITPDDPETVKLFHNLHERYKLYGSIEKAQLVPIQVYRSPTTPGKYRIFDGHRRTMVIFTMLMLPEIKAECVNITEEEAFKNAFEIHLRANLTAYDQGHYIIEELMKRYPTKYPDQESIAKNLRIDRRTVGYLVLAYQEVESQKSKLGAEVATRVANLPERTITHVRQAPVELRPTLFETIVEQKLSVRDTEKLVETVNVDPEPTVEKVVEEAKRIAEERAEAHMKSADKEMAKVERARDKVVVAGEEYPKELMTAVYGHLGLKGKVTPEKAKEFAKDVVDILVNRAIESNELDSALLEADLWK